MTIEDLLEFEQIKHLKYTYMRALDTQDWQLISSLFSGDAIIWFRDGTYLYEGKQQITNFFKSVLVQSFVSSHIAIHPEIELTSKTTAKAIWRFEDTVHFIRENSTIERDVHARDELQGAGYYHDEYVKVADVWKIKSTGYRRLYERIEAIGRRELVMVHPTK